jgi:hypothetical protein
VLRIGRGQRAEGRGQKRVKVLAFCLSFLLSTFSTALASSCEEQLPNAYKASFPGVEIYFGNFTGEDIQKGPYTLTQGVCIENVNGFQLITVEANVTIVDDAPNIEARNVDLSFENFQLTAETLQTNSAGLELTGVTFTGPSLQGMAEEASYAFETQELELRETLVQGESFTIEGKRAKLIGDQATFEDLTVTTCHCSGDPLYLVRAKRANLDLTTQTMNVNSGTLELAALRLNFNDVTISPQSLQDFRFPVQIEYVPGQRKDGGTGLGVRIPSLRIDDTLSLELGVVGLDTEHPLAGILVVHYKDSSATADVGLTPFGLQADFKVTETLAPWLNLSFGVNNRHWEKADFLHEGYLTLDANHALSVWEGDSLSLNAQVLSAGSSQELATGSVLDARLALNTNATYQAPALPLGQLELTAQTKLSYYPVAGTTQWGVRLAPRWRQTFGPASVDVLFSRQWTNGASPFSAKLDKLEPESRLIASTKLAGLLVGTLQGELNFFVNYNFLDINSYVGEGFASLAASGKLSYQINNLTVVPNLSLELAPLMNPDLDKDFRPLLNAGLDVISPSWEAGFGASYDLELGELSKLETRGSFTIDLGDVALEPFLALDVLPTLTDNTWPRISGHGLEVALQTCCGTLNVGYRQLGNVFTTTLYVTLEQRPEIVVGEQ